MLSDIVYFCLFNNEIIIVKENNNEFIGYQYQLSSATQASLKVDIEAYNFCKAHIIFSTFESEIREIRETIRILFDTKEFDDTSEDFLIEDIFNNYLFEIIKDNYGYDIGYDDEENIELNIDGKQYKYTTENIFPQMLADIDNDKFSKQVSQNLYKSIGEMFYLSYGIETYKKVSF